MAIVQALLALLARQAGRLLNTAFGWATIMLFGKVPEERQIYLLQVAAGLTALPHEPADADSERRGRGQIQPRSRVPRRALIPQLGGMLIFALLAWLTRSARRGAY